MIKKRGIGEEEGLWKSRCPFTKVLGERVNAHLPWVQHTEKFWYIFPNVSNLNALLHHITHTQDKIGVLSLQLVIRKGHFSSDDKLCAWNVNSPVSVSQVYSLLDVRTFVSPGSMYFNVLWEICFVLFAADFEECIEDYHNCPDRSTCSNEIGTFNCVCEDGYKFDPRVTVWACLSECYL